ncbi:hypothetical protein [Paraperlucidibaca sp.]|uniref:hypothetical protein n=1 Tax=Paraperlucidibaca sp. TaxID=2708021 RepID=UPI0030F3BF21
MSTINKKLLAISALPVALAVSLPARAEVDLSAITGAFSATDVVTGVLAVGAVLAVIYVSIKAAKTVIGMIRGG